MPAPIHRSIWFWQGMISPHMSGLAAALARCGCEVTYVAQQGVSEDRVLQGWRPAPLPGVTLRMAESAGAVRTLVASAPIDSIHLCGGLRGNGLIHGAQRALSARRLRQWVVMETVDDAGWRGVLRRLNYARLFRRWASTLQGVLAIGEQTTDWVTARGMTAGAVFPFAYFLPGVVGKERPDKPPSGPYRFLFVGQLIERKRLDLLIDCLKESALEDYRLRVVGSGPLEDGLRARAASALPGRVNWAGTLPMPAIFSEMVGADCLVLPSRHDGWGAVASEALMVGTPVICSDACGAAGVVRASGRGGVFTSNSRPELTRLLERIVTDGRPSTIDRQSLTHWARGLGAEAGAHYLVRILDHVDGRGPRPSLPWVCMSPDER